MGSSKIFFFHDGVTRQPHQSNKSCAIAGETEVAEQRLSPVQLVGHFFCRPYKKRDRPPKAWKLLSKWISDLATFSPTRRAANSCRPNLCAGTRRNGPKSSTSPPPSAKASRRPNESAWCSSSQPKWKRPWSAGKAGFEPSRRQEVGGSAAVLHEADTRQQAKLKAEGHLVQGPILGRRRQQIDGSAG